MSIHEIDEGVRIRVTKRVTVTAANKPVDEYIRRHEDSLLHLLIEKDLERAQFIINKLLGKQEAA